VTVKAGPVGAGPSGDSFVDVFGAEAKKIGRVGHTYEFVVGLSARSAAMISFTKRSTATMSSHWAIRRPATRASQNAPNRARWPKDEWFRAVCPH
jgi:hypothetical protein